MYYQNIVNITPDQSIICVGIGVEVSQCIDWMLNSQNINPKNIFLVDQHSIDSEKYPYLKLIPQENIFHNQTDFSIIHTIKNPLYLIKAPGIWSNHPDFEKFRNTNGIGSIISSLTFFIEQHKDRCIGITGTKGKTTTSSLLSHLFSKNQEVYYCGNSTGISPYKHWGKNNALFVLELSSFQLQDLGNSKVSPRYSILTNLYFDHQDVHHSIEEYWKAKTHIFNYSDTVCITSTQAQEAFLFDNINNDTYLALTDQMCEKIHSCITSPLLGPHNTRNIAMALLMHYCVSRSKAINHDSLSNLISDLENKKKYYIQIQDSFNSFSPVPYRNELVYTLQKNNITIRFFNDAQGTTPESTTFALDGLTQKDTEVCILLTGGKAKSPRYTLLSDKISELLSKHKLLDFYLFDEIGGTLSQAIKYTKSVPTNTRTFFEEGGLDLDSYVDLLEGSSITHINILLSPAGSSLNEFKNYKEKGDMFTQWAKNHI